MNDTISREAVSDAINGIECTRHTTWYEFYQKVMTAVEKLPPSELSTNLAEVGTDCISRQAAVDVVDFECGEWRGLAKTIINKLEALPAVQPERTCVNCGRTMNNGGWYADGRTRCPIEEHYALPKDGYCHLWEKRKDWEDDYVKRAEEGEK